MTGIGSPHAYFLTDDDQWFRPTAHARGPWSAEGCHAGPPTGMLARAMEHLLRNEGSDHRLVRLTVDLPRPVPMDGFRIEARIVRTGRSVTALSATLFDADGGERISASAIALRVAPERRLPTPLVSTPALDDAVPGRFPITASLHGLPDFFPGSVETRYPPGENPEPGPTTVWIRTVPLLEGEIPSPVQRICPLADCGNAFSRNAEPIDVGFVNPDLTLVLHREPEGEWLGAQAVSHWQPDGIGLADALLFDHRGVVGRALQTLLIT